LKLSIIVLIAVLVVGSLVISLGFLTNQNYDENPEIYNQYEELEKYKNELEKINHYNQQIIKDLDDLEESIKNSDDIHLEQINEEIETIKQVIDDNTKELERIIKKLSQIEPDTRSNTFYF